MRRGLRVDRIWRGLLLFAGLAVFPARLVCQDSVPAAQDSVVTPPEGGKPVASRADLQRALDQAEQIAASEGYSSELRDQKRAEAALIRQRLKDGDFLPGDQITIQAIGDSSLTGTFTVQPGRIITIPSLGDIPMTGVLRSEVNAYLKEQLGKYIKNPDVRARSLIRLSVLGGVGKPGFYQLDSDMLLTDALQAAGGIGNQTDLKKSTVNRQDEEIVPKEVFYQAITDGRTLDALNLQAGDEIQVGTKSTTDWFQTLRTVLLIPAAIVSIYGLGRLLGVF